MKIVLEKLDIKNYQNLVRRVPVADNVVEYAVKLVSATRPGSKNAPNFIKDSIGNPYLCLEALRLFLKNLKRNGLRI